MINDVKAYLAAGLLFSIIWVVIGNTQRAWMAASFFAVAYAVTWLIQRLRME